MTTTSKNQLKSRLSYLETLKRNLEYGNREVRMILEYLALSPIEQADLRAKWEEYFTNVRNTRAYERFQKQREALKENDTETVVSLAEEARRDREEGITLPKPALDDPKYLFVNASTQLYFLLQREINSVKNALRKAQNTIVDEVLEI